MISLGLNELIQYSLVNEDEYIKNEIKLINPLVKDYANLRSSLLPNILKSIQKNINQGNSIIEGFEYGHVFSKNDLNDIHELENVAGVLGGIQTKESWSEPSKVLNWFEAKGRIEQLFKKLNLSIEWKQYQPVKEKNILHPYSSTTIYLSNYEKLGIFGRINPILAKNLNISPNLYLFEFNFELIQKEINKNKLSVYKEYSTYPKIVKDLSFIVDRNINFSQIKKTIINHGTNFLNSVTLLDEYRGNSIPKNQTSLCLQLTFQSDTKTLFTKEIDDILKNLETVLIKEYAIKLRV